MKRSTLLSAFLALTATAGLAQAQTIDSIDGAAAGPGTVITLRGTGLAATTDVEFSAVVGGFVGVWSQNEPVISASATEVTVMVPDIVAGFVYVGPSVGGPNGYLRAITPSGASETAKFYFFEGTDGFLQSAGLGTTQSTGERSILSFELGGGEPTAGNPTFTPTLHNAVPGAQPFLAAGPFGSTPFGDGILAINPASIFLTIPGTLVGPDGNALVGPLPMPPTIPAGLSLSMQWGYLDPVTLAFELSQGMLAQY